MALALRIVMLLALSAAAQADQFTRFGDLDVHYIALNSTSVPAAVAAEYDLERGETVALINIAGRRRGAEEGVTDPVPLTVEGTVQNLLGQTLTLRFREVKATASTAI